MVIHALIARKISQTEIRQEGISNKYMQRKGFFAMIAQTAPRGGTGHALTW
jgi:hypothetical protein